MRTTSASGFAPSSSNLIEEASCWRSSPGRLGSVSSCRLRVREWRTRVQEVRYLEEDCEARRGGVSRADGSSRERGRNGLSRASRADLARWSSNVSEAAREGGRRVVVPVVPLMVDIPRRETKEQGW